MKTLHSRPAFPFLVAAEQTELTLEASRPGRFEDPEHCVKWVRVIGKKTPPKRGRRRREQHSFVMALWLVPEPSTVESLAAAQYSCPVQVVPDQLWSVCSP
jgi:hypothetical protein